MGTDYVGEYGITRSESYEDTESDGKGGTRSVTKTRTYTDWYHTSGTLPQRDYDFKDDHSQYKALHFYADYTYPQKIVHKVLSLESFGEYKELKE